MKNIQRLDPEWLFYRAYKNKDQDNVHEHLKTFDFQMKGKVFTERL
jgi:hypothetical protein